MTFRAVLDTLDVLGRPDVRGGDVAEHLAPYGVEVEVETVRGADAATDFVSCLVPGVDADRPTLGIVGRLGGLGARPEQIGLVSDADGAIVAIAAAAQLGLLATLGERVAGPVRVHTHICTRARTRPHSPVPLMRSPLPLDEMMAREVHPSMAAVVSVDTSRGNRYVNRRGLALTPVAKEGWLLPVPDPLLDLMSWVTGELPVTMPLATSDITPFGNGLGHVNSIMQPATVTTAPVIGLAVTAETAVPGCATGATNVPDLDAATRFCVEVAKSFTAGTCPFYDATEWQTVLDTYGSAARPQPRRPLVW